MQGAKLVIVFGSVRQRVAYFLWIFLLAALADVGFCLDYPGYGSALSRQHTVYASSVGQAQHWMWSLMVLYRQYRIGCGATAVTVLLVQSVQEEVDLYALFPPIKDVVYLVVVWLCVG